MSWIKAETPPKEDEHTKVLICFLEPFFGVLTPEMEVGYYSDGKWFFWINDKEVVGGGVTHWIPLPAPPIPN